MKEKMSKIIYAMNVSMDGFIEDSKGNLDWSVPDEELHQHFNELEKKATLHIYGRRLYETMIFWRNAEQNIDLSDYEKEYAHIWNNIPMIVVSTTLEKIDPEYILMREIKINEMTRYAKQNGEYIIVGGPNLAASFIQQGLVDEIRLYVAPVVLGEGKPMFLTGIPGNAMHLLETYVFKSGVVLLRYQLSMEGLDTI